VAKVDAASGTLTRVDNITLRGSCAKDIAVDPTGKHLYVGVENINTSGGSIQGFQIGPTGTLTELAGSPVIVEDLPVSLAMHPSGKFIFAATPDLSILDRDAATGMLTVRGIFNTPKKQLALNPAGTFLMASERDTNEISEFAVDDAGNLTEAFADRQRAKVPVGMAFDPTGRFAYAIIGGGGAIVAYALDWNSGALTAIAKPVATGGHAVSITVVGPK
jgi:6-phosphogluconolactonase (cycloisomerase 2 family)